MCFMGLLVLLSFLSVTHPKVSSNIAWQDQGLFNEVAVKVCSLNTMLLDNSFNKGKTVCAFKREAKTQLKSLKGRARNGKEGPLLNSCLSPFVSVQLDELLHGSDVPNFHSDSPELHYGMSTAW